MFPSHDRGGVIPEPKKSKRFEGDIDEAKDADQVMQFFGHGTDQEGLMIPNMKSYARAIGLELDPRIKKVETIAKKILDHVHAG